MKGLLTDTSDVSTYVTVPGKGSITGSIWEITIRVEFDLSPVKAVSGDSSELNIKVYCKSSGVRVFNETYSYDTESMHVVAWDSWAKKGWRMDITVNDAASTPLAKATYDIDTDGNIRKR